MLSRRWRDGGWVLLAVIGVLTLGLQCPGGAGHSLNRTGVAFALVSAAFWALYIVAGSRASTAVPGRGGLAVAMTVGALAGWVLLGQRTGLVTLAAITVVVLASAGAALTARPSPAVPVPSPTPGASAARPRPAR